MSTVVRPVVLSGGSGTRLWPLSLPGRPKQFLQLVGEPLIVQALDRIRGVAGAVEPLIVTGKNHVDLVEEIASRSGSGPYRTLVEPAGRNTAPAVIAAALVLDPGEIMVVLPADGLIADRSGFAQSVEAATELAAEGSLVTFGIVPDRPETGYGYIEKGATQGIGYRVARFKEKPEIALAEAMMADGNHLWNSGIFMFEARRLLAEAAKYAPELLGVVESAVAEKSGDTIMLGNEFTNAESISIDYAVMEKTESAVVVPVDVGWTDLGSWQAVWAVSPHDDDGNVMIGDVVASDVTGSYIYSQGRRVAVAGLADVVVVETKDAVLVVGKHASQDVKTLVEKKPDSASGN